ncbi:peroxisomal carnitine O-octanoyltransferase-like [Ptychodera flava]|uniref:peroxisomal carnitine O-octanoyltransferase-like n=1 Tax=Ptychodera flava TaxID=63121 RepID=UPI00396AA95D
MELEKSCKLNWRKEHGTHRNWLEEWWENLAYLSARTPNAINVNFAGPYPFHEEFWPLKYGTQLERMATLLWAYTEVWLTFRREELPVDKAKALGNTPVCMDQYRSIFNACRIPGAECDSIIRTFKTESEGPCSGTVIIFRNGHMFRVTVVDDNGNAVTPPEIEKQLKYIKELCNGRPAGPGIGALTAWDRASWAESRQYLISLDPENRKFLEDIESCIMCMNMDMDNSPTTSEQIGQLAMNGHDVANRWFDKFAVLVAYPNGGIGCNCDHSPADALVAVITVERILDLLRKINGKWKSTSPKRSLTPPKELKFIVDDRILRDIKEATEQYIKMADNLEFIIKQFTTFGKKVMREFKIHPDTTMQHVLQLSYHKMHGKPAPTYETATTRQYYHGRTETVRPCTQEAVEWCRAMLDPNAPASTKLQLFQKSVEKHNQLMFDCLNAQGFDRHLLGLQYLAVMTGHPIPEMFLDPAWTKR